MSASAIFFQGAAAHFFRPLTWQDREACAAVLRSLHERIHGPEADYAQALTKDLVLPDFEADAIRLVKRDFARRSPKVVQGAKAVEDTRGVAVAPRSLLSELVCEHPVAKAYLLALYGRVRQVDSEAELRRTPQGLMQQGLGSRAYGMFALLPALRREGRCVDQELWPGGMANLQAS